ncbi:hypothetical protein BC941DRAFT_473203 [Chlamydoabsidia padenii]|nr:hypothetical protein BC941DRAFT_473203 [Chlamydoabsidia padenii]
MNHFKNLGRAILVCLSSLKGSNLKSTIITRQSFNLQAAQQKLGFHSHNIEMYTAHHKVSTNETNSQLMNVLVQQPHLMQQLLDIATLLRTKGINPTGKQLGYFQVLKLMQDPEVMEKGQRLAAGLQQTGIILDRSTIVELQESLGRKEQVNMPGHSDLSRLQETRKRIRWLRDITRHHLSDRYIWLCIRNTCRIQL